MTSVNLFVNRSKPFDPKDIVPGEWKFLDEETDPRSKNLKVINISRVQIVSMNRKGEDTIGGEEKIARLKALGYIKLDACILRTLLDNKRLIPESWKEQRDGRIRFITFDGSVLADEEGDKYVLSLYWYWGDWHFGFRALSTLLNDGWNEYFPSAVLF